MQQRLIQLIQQDAMRIQALRVVADLNLPHGYIAAGFIRNLIWDDLHGYAMRTTLNDVDVIYFAPNEEYGQEKTYQQTLQQQMPEVIWQVKNQAYTHLLHRHEAYASVLDAMSYWPEQETAIAIRFLPSMQIEILSVFPLQHIFEGYIRHNPKAPLMLFHQRVQQKNWLKHWHLLQLEHKGEDV